MKQELLFLAKVTLEDLDGIIFDYFALIASDSIVLGLSQMDFVVCSHFAPYPEVCALAMKEITRV